MDTLFWIIAAITGTGVLIMFSSYLSVRRVDRKLAENEKMLDNLRHLPRKKNGS